MSEWEDMEPSFYQISSGTQTWRMSTYGETETQEDKGKVEARPRCLSDLFSFHHPPPLIVAGRRHGPPPRARRLGLPWVRMGGIVAANERPD